MTFLRQSMRLCVAASLLVLCSCATANLATPTESTAARGLKPNPDKSLVYILCSDAWQNGGGIKHYVEGGEKPHVLGILSQGTFLYVFTDASALPLKIDGGAPTLRTTIHLEPGKTYFYVYGRNGFLDASGSYIKELSDDEGRNLLSLYALTPTHYTKELESTIPVQEAPPAPSLSTESLPDNGASPDSQP